MKFNYLVTTTSIILTTAACSPVNLPEINQQSLCHASKPEDAHDCPVNELVLYGPPTWGNEQAMIAFSALFCDINHPVHFNVGGVLCIKTNARAHLW